MDININDIRLNLGSIPPAGVKKGKHTHHFDRRFLKGPIPWTWITNASRLPGKALQVGIALWFIAGLTKSRIVKMQGKLREEIGVSRQAYYSALERLEESGLISVQRKPGATPVVELQIL